CVSPWSKTQTATSSSSSSTDKYVGGRVGELKASADRVRRIALDDDEVRAACSSTRGARGSIPSRSSRPLVTSRSVRELSEERDGAGGDPPNVASISHPITRRRDHRFRLVRSRR